MEVVDEDPCRILPSPQVEGEDGPGPVREVALVQFMVRAVGDGGVADRFNLGHGPQVIHHLQSVLDMSFDPQGERFGPLQKQEGREGRENGACIAQENGPDPGDEGRGTQILVEAQTMVAGVRLGQGGELARHRRPVESASLYDDPTQGGAVAAYELRGGLHDHIRPVLQRPEQVRGGKGVINDNRQVVSMGDRGYGLEIRQIGVGVAEGLEEDQFGGIPDGRLEVARL